VLTAPATPSLLKDALSFPINLFPKQNIKQVSEISKTIIINACYKGICVEFERKNNTTWVFLPSKLPESTKHIL